MEAPLIEFKDDDVAYRAWLFGHLGGFVVNTERNPKPSYMILHRATCDTITPTPDRCFTCDYIKICSTSRWKLEAWAKSLGGRLTVHESCNP